MDGLRSLAALVAVDVFTAAKVPCWVVGFNYFNKLVLVAIVPCAVTLLLVVAFVSRAVLCHGGKKAGRSRHDVASLAFARRRGSDRSLVKAGLWAAAPFALQFVDLVWPTVCRTLLQLYTCRDLKSAGHWLEAASYRGTTPPLCISVRKKYCVRHSSSHVAALCVLPPL